MNALHPVARHLRLRASSVQGFSVAWWVATNCWRTRTARLYARCARMAASFMSGNALQRHRRCQTQACCMGVCAVGGISLGKGVFGFGARFIEQIQAFTTLWGAHQSKPKGTKGMTVARGRQKGVKGTHGQKEKDARCVHPCPAKSFCSRAAPSNCFGPSLTPLPKPLPHPLRLLRRAPRS